MFHIRNISLCMVIIEAVARGKNRNHTSLGKTPILRRKEVGTVSSRVSRELPKRLNGKAFSRQTDCLTPKQHRVFTVPKKYFGHRKESLYFP